MMISSFPYVNNSHMFLCYHIWKSKIIKIKGVTILNQAIRNRYDYRTIFFN